MKLPTNMVPVDKAKGYAEVLVRAGMSATDIASRAGIDERTVQSVLSGKYPVIMDITEECILGVPMPPDDYMPVVDGKADATGARRRLQALAVRGFPLSFVSPRVGSKESSLNVVRSGARTKILISRMVLIRRVHEEFCDLDPLKLGIGQRESSIAQAVARRGKWLPTEAWEDIDDPACEPRTKPIPKYVCTTENYRELTERFGLNRRQAAERMGMSVDAVNAALGYYEKRMAAAS